MSTHTCDAFVVTCIDFRFQKYLEDWLHQNLGVKQYDRVAWAGSVYDAAGIMKQLQISVKLHHVKKAVLINHEECGAYGETGTFERHKSDLIKFADQVKKVFPSLAVETYYLHLDGRFEEISR